jgi:hypothetical protein
MGSLCEPSSLHRITLNSENLIGRSPRCALRLNSGVASSVHAAVRWSPRGWEVKDLGSTNGSFLNGRRLETGRAHLLNKGDVLGFGNLQQTWVLEDDQPPHPMVVSDGGALSVGSELIAVPSSERPLATLYRDSTGAWFLEQSPADATPVIDGAEFEVGGQRWRFLCPSLVAQTDLVRQHDARGLRLVFEVSQDEEHVELLARTEGATIDLGVRANNYLLLILARQREQDVRAGLDERLQGWVHQEALARALASEPENINVDVFRLRRRFERHFQNAATIIERRARTGQLRLGIADFEIKNFEPSGRLSKPGRLRG